MIGLLKKQIARQIGNKVGLTKEEIRDVWEISQSKFRLEVGIDAMASTFGIVGIIAELAEMGIDFMICLKIWKYFNPKADRSAFIDVLKRVFSNKKLMLYYSAASISKNLLGKTLSIPIATHIVSGTINAIQTIALIMVWARICKEQRTGFRKIEISTDYTAEVAC